ncbi:MAG: 1,4-dihydroxy-6-naphthoate synthase [Chitinophagaceae bacterium]|nr:MAG: 1,4-dihydroxy-6-naphthoate synthase [Chitinophagaceae bacterium]
MKRNIDIGFSPCPNDTFIFDALVNGKIDTGNYAFTPVIEDVETLNKWAMKRKLPVTKVSYGIIPALLNDYLLLRSGGALGRGAGPLLIGKNDRLNHNDAVAIPGENTTAHMLFSLVYPQLKRKVFLRYDKIQDFVLEGKGAGVIIHENRFTYQALGLIKIQDLGEAWEQKTGLPIPLGGILASRSLHEDAADISNLIRKSLEYSWKQYPNLSAFITSHASEMSEEVMRKHINLYVNDYSLDLGEDGENAVKEFIRIHGQNSPASHSELKVF